MNGSPAVVLIGGDSLKGFGGVWDQDHFCAVTLRGFNIVSRRLLRHQDDGGQAEFFAGVGDRLRVIAAADGHQAAAPLSFWNAEDLVECAADFEGAGFLKEL